MKTHLITLAGAALALSTACGSERVDDGDDETVPATGAPSASAGGGGDDGGGGGGGQPPEDTCEPGAEEECSVVVGEQNGVKTCFRGRRRCQADATWSDCRMSRDDDAASGDEG
jgi:hypothetical protein